jgi:hypothetical protein
MHRFAVEYFPKPVAVNDLGWVAFRNDAYVLDLYGLGNDEVRTLKAAKKFDADAMQTLTSQHQTAFAMLYDGWFRKNIPTSWCRMATLHTSKISAAFDAVDFYSITEADRTTMHDALARFQRTLPTGARLTIHRHACSRPSSVGRP